MKNLKIRYYIAALIIVVSITLTPVAVQAAYEFRGYRAIGGEWLLLPLGLLVVMVVCNIAEFIEGTKSRRMEDDRESSTRNIEHSGKV